MAKVFKSRRLGPPARVWLPFYAAGSFTTWLLVSPKSEALLADRKWIVLLPLAAAWLYVGQPWRVLLDWLSSLGSPAQSSGYRSPGRSSKPRQTRRPAKRPAKRPATRRPVQAREPEIYDDETGPFDQDHGGEVVPFRRSAEKTQQALAELLDGFSDVIHGGRNN